MYGITENRSGNLPLALSLDPVTVAEAASSYAVNTVDQYFTWFNQADYGAVASLFAVDGILSPPFEAPVVGREAIASYLRQEADGMVIDRPTVTSLEMNEDGTHRISVRGHVTALVFKVGVAWEFNLNPQQDIDCVAIKLLATLEELVGLRSR